MSRQMAVFFVLAGAGLMGCGAPEGGFNPNEPAGGVDAGLAAIEAEPTECGNSHFKVGQLAVLETHAHDVAGIAAIVDDCTIQIDMFNFDGTGLDVQIYGALGGDYEHGFSMSDDIRRDKPYVDESMTVRVPDGLTLDDLDGVSVWCVPAGADFGSGIFAEAP